MVLKVDYNKQISYAVAVIVGFCFFFFVKPVIMSYWVYLLCDGISFKDNIDFNYSYFLIWYYDLPFIEVNYHKEDSFMNTICSICLSEGGKCI